MAKCNQLTLLPFKGLNEQDKLAYAQIELLWTCILSTHVCMHGALLLCAGVRRRKTSIQFGTVYRQTLPHPRSRRHYQRPSQPAVLVPRHTEGSNIQQVLDTRSTSVYQSITLIYLDYRTKKSKLLIVRCPLSVDCRDAIN